MAVASTKRLRSVAHSTAHHAVSGLCYVHPHLGIACEARRLRTVEVDLLRGGFNPPIDPLPDEIKLSTEALRQKFAEILTSEKIDKELILRAKALFQFDRGRWPSGCYVQLETVAGKEIEVAVDSTGQLAEVIHTRT
jgi:hypothetical protein